MNKKAFLSGVGQFLIVTAGLIITLWQGVNSFSDVNETAYGVAVLTGIGAFVHQYRARMADKPTEDKTK